MKVMRKIIKIDEELCDGCGQCVPSCAEGALEIVDGKARIVADVFCDGLGACLGECPTGALEVIEREAEDFDEAAVEERLSEMAKQQERQAPAPQHGCPSARLQTFQPLESCGCQDANKPAAVHTGDTTASALTHWPVQIRLIPPTAPFLKGADLLVVADCAPVAFAHLHRDYLKGKTVMMGCPKFDDAQAYIDKFAEIFKTADIKRITTLVMEVPCCAGLPVIVKKGLEMSGKKIPLEEVVVSTRGKILNQLYRFP